MMDIMVEKGGKCGPWCEFFNINCRFTDDDVFSYLA